tara:strand:+ start:3071 stop:3358 length:288 start_codon:yes stop_codon:yes gene_type:complete
MNPFFNKPDKLTNDIADILARNRQAASDAIPDSIKNAAKAAGAEARSAGHIPQETKTAIYNKHFTGAVGDGAVNQSTRQSFETMADQEFNTPSAE